MFVKDTSTLATQSHSKDNLRTSTGFSTVSTSCLKWNSHWRSPVLRLSQAVLAAFNTSLTEQVVQMVPSKTANQPTTRSRVVRSTSTLLHQHRQTNTHINSDWSIYLTEPSIQQKRSVQHRPRSVVVNSLSRLTPTRRRSNPTLGPHEMKQVRFSKNPSPPRTSVALTSRCKLKRRKRCSKAMYPLHGSSTSIRPTM